ncbi:MAG TPA: tRNA cyclic N6-threonylcarbamoyladenosine(37) synthase TcdA [Clostridiales bacterium]|nr:MAG: tRNA cyclic N6-threonylcarbamoyladenosine(37) synthase TcdA [Clostridiales bacterium GWD2_32_59]HAN10482.1 tRNA cyclic N6-threonylcarbamoyladenosine(37) synthase TcdA [Clostridiales bacterium]
MLHEFSRMEILIGTQALEKLKQSKVAIFGIGGVGGYALEGLVRCGIGSFVLVDDDVVSITNINRQIIATTSTLEKSKVEVARERILDINPNVKVTIHQKFYLPETRAELVNNTYDYIVDAVDTVTAKIDLVLEAARLNIPIISSMGTGNKLYPTMLEVSDISKTSVCPLAKVMRRELRRRGINSLKVVYSKEEPIKAKQFIQQDKESKKRQTPGSISFVPSVAGLIIASEVVKDIISYTKNKLEENENYE